MLVAKMGLQIALAVEVGDTTVTEADATVIHVCGVGRGEDSCYLITGVVCERA